MQFDQNLFQRAAFWLAGPFLAAAVAEPLLTQTLQDHGVLKRPETWIWLVIIFFTHIFETRWFEILTALLVGIAIGTSVEARLRRKEVAASTGTLQKAAADKVSDIVATTEPVALKIQFSANHEQPVGLHQTNVLGWYVTWSSDFVLDWTGEGMRERVITIPKTYSVFVLFDKPAKFKQLRSVYSKSSSGDGVFNVSVCTQNFAVLISQSPITDGILDVFSAD